MNMYEICIMHMHHFNHIFFTLFYMLGVIYVSCHNKPPFFSLYFDFIIIKITCFIICICHIWLCVSNHGSCVLSQEVGGRYARLRWQKWVKKYPQLFSILVVVNTRMASRKYKSSNALFSILFRRHQNV